MRRSIMLNLVQHVFFEPVPEVLVENLLTDPIEEFLYSRLWKSVERLPHKRDVILHNERCHRANRFAEFSSQLFEKLCWRYSGKLSWP